MSITNNINLVITVISILATVISWVFAWWQIRARLNIQKMLQQESFHLHSSVGLVLGNCQAAINKIKENQIPDALISASKAEGGTQMLLQQTVKLICHYYDPTDADIVNWTKRGKVNKGFKHLFLVYSEKNKGWLRSKYRKIKEKIY